MLNKHTSRYRRYTVLSATGTETGGPSLDELSEACSERFLHPWFVVRPEEETGTVWVSVTGGSLTIGLRPAMIERRGLGTVFTDTVARLADAWPEA